MDGMSESPWLPAMEKVVRMAATRRPAAATPRATFQRSGRVRRVAFAFVLSLATAGCAGTPSPVGSPTQVAPTGSPAASSPSAAPSRATPRPPTLPPELAGSDEVSFTADDGVHLEGRLFGSGSIGVILAHGNDDAAQATWFFFAAELARSGYLVLTFDFRGSCPGDLGGCSAGSDDPPNSWHDLVGAITLLKEKGARAIFLVGASKGSRSVLWAAAHGVTVAGLVLVSSVGLKAAPPYSPAYDFTPTMIAHISEPKLFVAGLHDATAPDSAATTRAMYLLARKPKELALIDSTHHGPALLQGDGPDVREATRVVLAFLSKYR